MTLTPNAAYLVGSPSTATVTLTSNDGTVTVTAPDGTAAGADRLSNTGRFRFSRSDTPVAGLPALTVPYTVSGTATPGSDYLTLSGSAIIPVNAAFVDVVVDCGQRPRHGGIRDGHRHVDAELRLYDRWVGHRHGDDRRRRVAAPPRLPAGTPMRLDAARRRVL